MFKKTLLIAAHAVVLAGQVQAAPEATQQNGVANQSAIELLGDSELGFVNSVEMEETKVIKGRNGSGCK